MATLERETCENCCGEFEPDFPKQRLCYSCWKELNPAKNFRLNGREMLLVALGEKNKPNSILECKNQITGISDDELLLDNNYIENTAQSLSTDMRQEPECEVSNTRNPQQVAGQRRSEHGLVGKFLLMEKAVLVGRFHLKEKQVLQQKPSEERQMAAKKVCESKPSRIRIVSQTGEVRFITSEKAMAILSEIPL